jgi:ribose transport system substrate-binding protein
VREQRAKDGTALRAAAAIAVLLAGLVVAACGGSSGGGGKAGSKDVKDVKIFYSVYDRQAAFFRGCIAGVEGEAKKLGINLDVQVSGPDPTKQIQQMETAILRKPDVIILTPIDANALSNVAKKALNAGIPVIGLCDDRGSVDPRAGEDRISYVGPDYKLMGELKAKYAAEAIKGKGKVGAFYGVRGVPFDVAARRGYEQELAKYPGIEYVEGPYSNEYTAEAGLKSAQNLLTANPDLNALICDQSDQCIGAIKAIKDRGIKPADIFVSSNDGIAPELDAIRRGEIDFTIAWCAYDEGATAVRQGVDLMTKGEEPPEFTLDVGRELTTETITPGAEPVHEKCAKPNFKVTITQPKSALIKEVLGKR